MIVIKRSKKAQEFDRSKLVLSIKKAFQSCDSDRKDELDLFESIVDKIPTCDGMRTEDIQSLVEVELMKEGFYKEAKFFIIHRHIKYHDNVNVMKAKFMREYLSAANAATGSKYDANANVTEKNLATLSGELFKGNIIKLNRYRLYSMIEKLYGKDLADEYIRQLEEHEIYKHDESSIYPYCVAISMYPYLLHGLSELGGMSTVPNNLDSFCGSFINLVFAVSAQFAGAVATGEFLMYFDYFARKDYGHDYQLHLKEFYTIGPKLRQLMNSTGLWFKDAESLAKHDFEDESLNKLRDELVYDSTRSLTDDEIQDYIKSLKEGNPRSIKLGDGSRTIQSSITQYFQQIVYSLNQPAAARSYQSVFWNISYFDKYYFDGMFRDFRFPDGTAPVWNSLNPLQKMFMEWFNAERTKAVLTFPVETLAMLTDDKDVLDKEYGDFCAKMQADGHSFFVYLSNNVDSLSSCCRLRNEVTENTFSYTLGAGGIATGSKSVMTLNLNRLIQQAIKKKLNYVEYLREQVKKLHKYQTAFNELLKEFYEMKALPVYDAGFISLNKQYLTIGINGMIEAAEFLGIKAVPSEQYKDFVSSILSVLYNENKAARTKELMFNTEFVPAENLGVKFYKWDKEDGYWVPTTRQCYNSYYYASEDTSLTILDKFTLHGEEYVKYLDGGSALHMNLDDHLSQEQYRQLLRVAVNRGTNYFTYNIPNTICNDCGHIDKRNLKCCPNCGSQDIDYLTRVIGYLKRIGNFSAARQLEAKNRYYLPKSGVEDDQIRQL